MSDITKIKVNGDPESSYQLYPRNNEFDKRANIQPNWNQNDNTQPDYVKNRPFYTDDPVETVLVEESTVEFEENNGMHGVVFPSSFNAEFGQIYKIYWDGTVYECVCENYSDLPIIGNQSIMGIGSDTGEPFIIFNQIGLREEGWASLTTDTSASHTISINGLMAPIVKIDEKYLSKYTELLPYHFWLGYTKEKLIRICDEFATGKIFSVKTEVGSNATSLILHALYSNTVGFYFVFLDNNYTMKKISGGPDNWTTQTFAITWS